MYLQPQTQERKEKEGNIVSGVDTSMFYFFFSFFLSGGKFALFAETLASM